MAIPHEIQHEIPHEIPLASSLRAPRNARRCALRAACAGVALACAGLGSALAAHPQVSVHDAWIRWLPAGLPAAGYMRVENHSSKPVTLVNADSPRHYSSVMLHETLKSSGLATMGKVDGVVIPAHSVLHFAPGGYHIMLMNPKHAIKPGASIPIVLRFAGGGHVTAHFIVRKSDASADEGEAPARPAGDGVESPGADAAPGGEGA